VQILNTGGIGHVADPPALVVRCSVVDQVPAADRVAAPIGAVRVRPVEDPETGELTAQAEQAIIRYAAARINEFTLEEPLRPSYAEGCQSRAAGHRPSH
jgi:hypothetical protein